MNSLSTVHTNFCVLLRYLELLYTMAHLSALRGWWLNGRLTCAASVYCHRCCHDTVAIVDVETELLHNP